MVRVWITQKRQWRHNFISGIVLKFCVKHNFSKIEVIFVIYHTSWRTPSVQRAFLRNFECDMWRQMSICSFGIFLVLNDFEKWPHQYYSYDVVLTDINVTSWGNNLFQGSFFDQFEWNFVWNMWRYLWSVFVMHKSRTWRHLLTSYWRSSVRVTYPIWQQICVKHFGTIIHIFQKSFFIWIFKKSCHFMTKWKMS